MSKQMTNELTFEQIDSWFRIGGPPTVQTTYVPRSSTKTNVNNDSLLGQGFGRGLTRPVYTPGQHRLENSLTLPCLMWDLQSIRSFCC